jgi:hypothetical protein
VFEICDFKLIMAEKRPRERIKRGYRNFVDVLLTMFPGNAL